MRDLPLSSSGRPVQYLAARIRPSPEVSNSHKLQMGGSPYRPRHVPFVEYSPLHPLPQKCGRLYFPYVGMPSITVVQEASTNGILKVLLICLQHCLKIRRLIKQQLYHFLSPIIKFPVSATDARSRVVLTSTRTKQHHKRTS